MAKDFNRFHVFPSAEYRISVLYPEDEVALTENAIESPAERWSKGVMIVSTVDSVLTMLVLPWCLVVVFLSQSPCFISQRIGGKGSPSNDSNIADSIVPDAVNSVLPIPSCSTVILSLYMPGSALKVIWIVSDLLLGITNGSAAFTENADPDGTVIFDTVNAPLLLLFLIT